MFNYFQISSLKNYFKVIKSSVLTIKPKITKKKKWVLSEVSFFFFWELFFFVGFFHANPASM